MATTYEIPLSPEAQTFRIQLAGTVYELTLKWGTFANSWLLDIADVHGVLILGSLPLVANTDLLEPYPYLNFNGQLVAQTDSNSDLPPTYEGLGTVGHLRFVVP